MDACANKFHYSLCIALFFNLKASPELASAPSLQSHREGCNAFIYYTYCQFGNCIFDCPLSHSLILIFKIYSMNKIATNIQSLIFKNQFSFSKDLFFSGSHPIKHRVMSTPTWPVPYYQRLAKAYPIRQTEKPRIEGIDYPADDSTWLRAKVILNESAKGRQIVSYTQQNIQTKSYLIHKDDCETMVKSYVNDISQFLDITNKQNSKILSGKTFI